jgi:hypothetical protein
MQVIRPILGSFTRIYENPAEVRRQALAYRRDRVPALGLAEDPSNLLRSCFIDREFIHIATGALAALDPGIARADW